MLEWFDRHTIAVSDSSRTTTGEMSGLHGKSQIVEIVVGSGRRNRLILASMIAESKNKPVAAPGTIATVHPATHMVPHKRLQGLPVRARFRLGGGILLVDSVGIPIVLELYCVRLHPVAVCGTGFAAASCRPS